MSTRDGGQPGDGPADARRRRGPGIRRMMVLVASCAALLWSWRQLTENYDPTIAEARSRRQRAFVQLSSGETAERLAAIDTLEMVRLGDDSVAVGPLVAALDDADPRVRLAVARALGSVTPGVITSADAVDLTTLSVNALGRGARDDNPDVRSMALISLGTIAATLPVAAVGMKPLFEKAMETLARGTEDPDADVRLAVIRVMTSRAFANRGGPQEELVAALADPSVRNRLAAIRELVHFDQGFDPWLERLLRLAEKDPEPEVRGACIEVLRQPMRHPPSLRSGVVPTLITATRSPEPKVRATAAHLLGRLGIDARTAVPDLMRLLNDPAVPALDPLEDYRSSVQRDPGSEAAIALGSIALGTLDEPRVIRAMIEVARGGPPLRRACIAETLGRFGLAAAEAIPILSEMLKDPGPLGSPADPETASIPQWTQRWAATSLMQITVGTPEAEEAVRAIVPLLDSRSYFVRWFATETLGHFGSQASGALPRLRQLQASDPNLRESASRAIGWIEALATVQP